jgi:hypothetical protein
LSHPTGWRVRETAFRRTVVESVVNKLPQMLHKISHWVGSVGTRSQERFCKIALQRKAGVF